MSEFTASTASNLRRHRRYPVHTGVLQVWWLDMTGKMRMTRTRTLNISEDGIAILLPQPVMPELVRFESDRFQVRGKGQVRYCHRYGNKYLVGLEFTGGLHWRAPEGDVLTAIPLSYTEPTVGERLLGLFQKK